MSILEKILIVLLVASLFKMTFMRFDCKVSQAHATSQEYVAEFYKKDAKRWMAIRGLYREEVGNDLERWVDNIIKLKEYKL